MNERELEKRLVTDLEIHNESCIVSGRCEINEEGYILGVFRKKGLRWLLLPNKYYDENIKMEFPNKYYKAIPQVPKYVVKKNKRKIANACPRIFKNGDKFLIITLFKNRKKFYILDVNEDYQINDKAEILYDIASEGSVIRQKI